MGLAKNILAILGVSVILLVPHSGSSQNDSTEVYRPGRLIQDGYITDFKKQLTVKLEVENDDNSYNIYESGNKLELKQNLNLRYALVFSYKFLTVRLGIRPKISEEDLENKGDSDVFRLKFQLLFDNWSHLVEYNYNRGYYVTNTGSYYPRITDFSVQFPRLTSNILYGSSAYKFNERYSVRSILSQTEVQSKSAGTFMPGISYNFFTLSGTDYLLFPGESVQRENFNEYRGINLQLTAGYYYTFVIASQWYVNLFGIPAVGLELYQTKSFSESGVTNRNFNGTFFNFDYGLGGGFNGDKFFFGFRYINRESDQKFDENIVQIQSLKNSFKVFVGYRFKPPKKVLTPIDKIEEKIPILNNDKRQ